MRSPDGFGTDMATDQHQRHVLGKLFPYKATAVSKLILLLCQSSANNLYKHWHYFAIANTSHWIHFIAVFRKGWLCFLFSFSGCSQWRQITFSASVNRATGELSGICCNGNKIHCCSFTQCYKHKGQKASKCPCPHVPHIAKFSALRFEWHAKEPWFSSAAREGWPWRAGCRTGIQEGCSIPFTLTPPICTVLLCSLWPTLPGWPLEGGISESEGLLSVQVVEHHSSKHIPPTSFPVTSWISTLFPRRLPHTPPVGPCWQLTWLYTAARNANRFFVVSVWFFLLSSHLSEPLAVSLHETCYFHLVLLDSGAISLSFSSLLKICNLGKLKAI